MASEGSDIGDATKNVPSLVVDPVSWKREHEKLMNMISEFEEKLSHTNSSVSDLENQLKVRTEERDAYKIQVQELQDTITEFNNEHQQQKLTESQTVDLMKKKSEEMLTRAKGIIFEKTKICKNQELQIEALTQQVASLKEVVSITKDLLEIRNVEVKHLQDQIDKMEANVENEKARYNLMHSKLDKMVQMNSDLKREYETQLCLFTALRERYSERELAKGVLENLRRENGDVANGGVSTTDANSDDPDTKE